MWTGTHYVDLRSGFRSEARPSHRKLCKNAIDAYVCAWCCAGSTSETCWPRWLNCLVSHLRSAASGLYDRAKAHWTKPVWDQSVLRYAGPTAWNALHTSSCDATADSACFRKKGLKTFLFQSNAVYQKCVSWQGGFAKITPHQLILILNPIGG